MNHPVIVFLRACCRKTFSDIPMTSNREIANGGVFEDIAELSDDDRREAMEQFIKEVLTPGRWPVARMRLLEIMWNSASAPQKHLAQAEFMRVVMEEAQR